MFVANWNLTLTTKQVGGTTNLVSAAASVANAAHDNSTQDFVALTSGQVVTVPVTRGDSLLIIADHPLKIQVNGAIAAFSAQYLFIDGADRSLFKVDITNEQPVNVSAQVITLGS